MPEPLIESHAVQFCAKKVAASSGDARRALEVCRAAGVDASLVLSYATQTDERFCKRVGVPLEALRVAQENV